MVDLSTSSIFSLTGNPEVKEVNSIGPTVPTLNPSLVTIIPLRVSVKSISPISPASD